MYITNVVNVHMYGVMSFDIANRETLSSNKVIQ